MTELYMPKTCWALSPAPTGPHRSFQHRSWPLATYHNKDGPPAARMIPILVEHKSYRPDLKEIAPLQVGIADYRVKDQTFVWRKLTMAVTGYSSAVSLWEDWLYAHLEDWVIPLEEMKS